MTALLKETAGEITKPLGAGDGLDEMTVKDEFDLSEGRIKNRGGTNGSSELSGEDEEDERKDRQRVFEEWNQISADTFQKLFADPLYNAARDLGIYVSSALSNEDRPPLALPGPGASQAQIEAYEDENKVCLPQTGADAPEYYARKSEYIDQLVQRAQAGETIDPALIPSEFRERVISQATKEAVHDEAHRLRQQYNIPETVNAQGEYIDGFNSMNHPNAERYRTELDAFRRAREAEVSTQIDQQGLGSMSDEVLAAAGETTKGYYRFMANPNMDLGLGTTSTPSRPATLSSSFAGPASGSAPAASSNSGNMWDGFVRNVRTGFGLWGN